MPAAAWTWHGSGGGPRRRPRAGGGDALRQSGSAHLHSRTVTHPATIIHVLGVPMDLGSGRRGVDMGPSAIRIAGLAERLTELGHKVVDEGDLAIKNMEALKVGDVRAR